MCPHAYLNDGLMDVLVIGNFELSDLGQVVVELNDVRNKDNQYVHYRKRQTLDVELTSSNLPINLDGEPYRWDKIHFEVHAKAIRLVAPIQDNPLFVANKK